MKSSVAMERAALVALPVLAIAVFVNALPNAFVFDDVHQVVANPWIRDFTHIREIFTTHVWAFAGRDSNYYRPLMHVAYALVYTTFGPAPWAFRAVGVLLHAASTILVFLIAVRLDPQRTGVRWTAPARTALVAGVLFAVHPVHVEAVAWISSLPDLACAALYLAGVLAFLASSDVCKRALGLHVLGALAFLGSALFKEPGITLPALVVLWDLLQRAPARPRIFWATRYGGLALSMAVYAALRLNAIHGIVPHASQSRFGAMEAMDIAGAALWRYLGMLVWPFPLNVFRTMEDATGLPSYIALLGLPVLVALAWRRRDARATIGLGLLLFPILPALYAPALLPGLDNPWAERYVYLSSAGFAIVVAAAGDSLNRWLPPLRLPLIAALGVVVLAFGVATVARNQVWRNDLTLWTDAVRQSPRAAAARSYLGWALFSGGEVGQAIEQYRAAIALNPGFADAHHNLAVGLASKGLHEAALPSYLEAIRLKPRDALSRANMSISLTRLGRHGAAQTEALRAIELDPRSSRAHGALGIALGEAGRIQEAADSFRQALEFDPADAQNRANLATAEKLLSTAPRRP